MPEYDYSYFKNEIQRLTGINLTLYKEKQMKRRIDTRIERMKFTGYRDYAEKLQRDEREREDFLSYITINVSFFFRTPEHWETVEATVMPQLAREAGERSLKIWSAACASGEEPYSIVMSLAEYVPLERIEVLATDLDERILTKAKRGIYQEREIESVPERMKEKYFRKEGMREWEIAEEVRNAVTFRKMDLLSEEYPDGFDLIVLRNVLIYFTDEAKNEIYRKMYQSLRKGGVLFTGNTEQIIQYKSFGYQKEKNYLYRK